MWPAEIVIDTNVLVHACNHDSPYFESAVSLVTELPGVECVLALDDSGKSAPNQSTSHLYNEYSACMNPLQLPMIVLASLLSAGRVHFYPRLKTTSTEWKYCCRIVPRNKHDRVVLGVAVLCREHTLVSNDFDDFNEDARDVALEKLSVRILDSEEFGHALEEGPTAGTLAD
jgi:hypothetical protein